MKNPSMLTPTPATVKQPRTTQEQHALGWQLYQDGKRIEECASLLQRRGWQAAHNGNMAAADCETAGYLAKVSVR